jgi:hypothetical protein
MQKQKGRQMTKFKIFGDLVYKYSLEVEAESLAEAYEKADAADRTEWIQLELDNSIEPYDFELVN